VDENDGNVNPLSKGQDEHIDSGGVSSLIALVPIVFLFGLVLFLFHMKSKAAGAVLNSEDDMLIVGTGDHPRSYHEGLYHFTQAGTRYLSTNCEYCRDTRMYGLMNSTTSNLSRDYKPRKIHVVGESDSILSRSTGHSKDGGSDDVDSVLGPYGAGPLAHIGRKYGDVHVCSSATCELCEQRRQEGLQFPPKGTPPSPQLLLPPKQVQTVLVEEDNNAIVVKGDPIGSFHDGRYHFTETGTRYLSTNCERCSETQKDVLFNLLWAEFENTAPMSTSSFPQVAAESESILSIGELMPSSKDSGSDDDGSILGPYGGPLGHLG
jgi:hypothetical protein